MVNKYETVDYWGHDQRWYDEKASEHLSKTIFEKESSLEFSGLYNAKGQKLFRVEEKRKIGFW